MIFLKLALVLVYLVLLIAVYRVADYIAWSDAAGVASTLVDPLALSLRQLRWLLHARGINYQNVIEKQDLTDLISSSGAITNEELSAAKEIDLKASFDTVTFTKNSEFDDSISNSEDVWLVQIVTEHTKPVISESEWKKLVKRSQAAGLHTGLIVCKDKPYICESRSFLTSQLLISYHYKKNKEGIHQKHYLTRQCDASSAFNWVANIAQGAIEEIPDLIDFTRDWLSLSTRRSNPIQLAYVSPQGHAPVIFAGLKTKFKDGVRFGMLSVTDDTSNLQNLLDVTADLPKTFLCVITATNIYIYGDGLVKGNLLHFLNLHMFLQSINPDINTLFTWSFYVCNLLATLSVFTMTSNNVFTRIIAVVKSFLAYNAVVLGSWLAFSNFTTVSLSGLTSFIRARIQEIATTQPASELRYYIMQISLNPYPSLIGFLIFFCVTLHALRKLNLISNEPDPDTILSDILLSNENRSFANNDLSQRWIERLATPGLWLQPLVPSDYIEELPVWKYAGECSSSTDDSDTEPRSSSARTSSPSPSRGWSSQCSGPSRGRSYFATSGRQTASHLKKGLLWSIQSCFRGLSPRVRQTPGPPKGMREENSCSVCLDNYKTQSTVCGLPCGHVFHHECILSWLHGDRHCCPICRWPAYQARYQTH